MYMHMYMYVCVWYIYCCCQGHNRVGSAFNHAIGCGLVLDRSFRRIKKMNMTNSCNVMEE